MEETNETQTAFAEREATQQALLDLAKTTIIGIFLDPENENPRALLHLSQGRTAMVAVGTKIGAATVSAIVEGTVTILRDGQETVLGVLDPV